MLTYKDYPLTLFYDDTMLDEGVLQIRVDVPLEGSLTGIQLKVSGHPSQQDELVARLRKAVEFIEDGALKEEQSRQSTLPVGEG